jgi:beta-alanine--pyruvate transaminase
VGFGGISVGGIPANRKMFGTMLNGVDHLPYTHNLEKNAFSRGQPAWGAHLADDLERLVALHDASTIAAVIVEPMAGSTGVLIPPKGYLQRLREITSKHGILLIFDEVITAFGRMGANFAADVYGVQPDMITFAKGVTSGTVMGRALSLGHLQGIHVRTGGNRDLPRLHVFGASAACAAGIASWTLDAIDRLFEAYRRAHGAQAGGRASFAEGRAPRDRHPQPRARGRGRARAAPGRSRRARVRGVPQVL